jgi:hypothetical protein
MSHPLSFAPPRAKQETRDRPLLVHHVARICGIARRTVRWAAAIGVLKGFRDPATPKIWRFFRKEVIEFKERRDAARRARQRQVVRRAA